MRVTSYSELRRNLAANLDKVHEDREPVLVTRDSGKPAAVVMSLDEYNSFVETLHLMRSPRNAMRLQESIDELDAGGGTQRNIAG